MWLAGVQVGVLTRRQNGNLQFRYRHGYDGPPVSHCLPLQQEAHPHRLVRAVFGGLLPEGDVRDALAGNLGVSSGNDYVLLDAVGGDVAGALTLLPEGETPPTVGTIRPVGQRQLAALLGELPQRPLAVDPEGGIRLSLAGAQPKVPVILDVEGGVSLPTNAAAPTTHILKPEPARFPGLVDNEAYCMDLARACGLAVAPVRKGLTLDGLPYLVVERYDRDLTTEPIRRLHQEDFCQALGLPADQKYQAEGGPSFAHAAQLVRDATAVPAQDLPRLVEAITLHWLVGNCDAHGKNYSLLYGRTAGLAPLYHVVSTVAYPELTRRLAMSIGPARSIDEVGMSAWERLAMTAGLRPAFVRRTVLRLAQQAAEHAADLATRPEHNNTFAAAVRDRIVRLADDVSSAAGPPRA